MYKLKRALAALALALSLAFATVGTSVSPASAYLTNCYATATDATHMFSVCYGHANNGGLNQQRAYLWCGDDFDPTHNYLVLGAWVNQNYRSYASCNYGGGWVSLSYQLR